MLYLYLILTIGTADHVFVLDHDLSNEACLHERLSVKPAYSMLGRDAALICADRDFMLTRRAR